MAVSYAVCCSTIRFHNFIHKYFLYYLRVPVCLTPKTAKVRDLSKSSLEMRIKC